MNINWIVALLLMSSVGVAQAQEQTEWANTRRLYAELSATNQWYVVKVGNSVTQIAVNPLEVAVGYRLTPKWRVQLGVARRNPNAEGSSGSYMNADGKEETSSYYFKEKNLSIPMHLHYVLAGAAPSKWRLDAVAGLTLVFYEFQEKRLLIVENITQQNTNVQVEVANSYATVGLELRRLLGTRFQAVGRVGHAFNLEGVSEMGTPLTYQANVGLAYYIK